MGKVNGCLKCLFIFFNVVFAIIGCILIFGTVKATAYSHQLSSFGSPGLGWSWVFSIGVLGISCLGIYAGSSENSLALKIFAGFMGVGMVIMLIFGIYIAVIRNKIQDSFYSLSSEIAKPFMEDKQMRALLEEVQLTAKCCGVVNAEDWGDDIPDSCECRPLFGGYDGYDGFQGFHSATCKPKPLGVKGPDQIYSKPCSDVIFMYINLAFQIAMGFFFGFAVTALLGLLVSILMIHQIKRYDNAGVSSIAMKGY